MTKQDYRNYSFWLMERTIFLMAVFITIVLLLLVVLRPDSAAQGEALITADHTSTFVEYPIAP